MACLVEAIEVEIAFRWLFVVPVQNEIKHMFEEIHESSFLCVNSLAYMIEETTNTFEQSCHHCRVHIAHFLKVEQFEVFPNEEDNWESVMPHETRTFLEKLVYWPMILEFGKTIREVSELIEVINTWLQSTPVKHLQLQENEYIMYPGWQKKTFTPETIFWNNKMEVVFRLDNLRETYNIGPMPLSETLKKREIHFKDTICSVNKIENGEALYENTTFIQRLVAVVGAHFQQTLGELWESFFSFE